MGCLTGSGVIFTRGLGRGSHLLPRKKILKQSSGLIFDFNFSFDSWADEVDVDQMQAQMQKLSENGQTFCNCFWLHQMAAVGITCIYTAATDGKKLFLTFGSPVTWLTLALAVVQAQNGCCPQNITHNP